MNRTLFTLGILLLLLPFGLKFYGNHRQQEFVSTYEREVEKIEGSKLQSILEAAYTYNEELYLSDEFHEEEYESQLNMFGNGVMGSVEIPKIDVKLPVYHGTEEEILTNGIGHLKESSLPVKGENCHSVLTGHRGLPEAQLFTRLDEIEMSDMFYLNICGEQFSYRVCDVQIVKPEDVEILEIQPGRSLVSLITCTPYGINTHRLVVTGEYLEEIEVEKEDVDHLADGDIIFLVLLLLLVGIGCVYHFRKRGSK